jgi:hypothetical protein
MEIGMRIQAIVVRLAALLVLVSSACDCCAFDLNDPEAPMNRPGSVLVVQAVLAVNCAVVKTSDLPDDHCLCCSPGIVSPTATFESPFLISSTVENRAQPTIPEVQMIERPPRS